MPGTIPLRGAGDGTAPVPGWSSQFEWTDYVPFKDLPMAFSPPREYLASSNNKIAPDSVPTSWAAASQRLTVLAAFSSYLAQTTGTLTDMERIRGDVLAIHARELLPLLLHAVPADGTDRQAVELLKSGISESPPKGLLPQSSKHGTSSSLKV
jgi:penicillin G amidase